VTDHPDEHPEAPPQAVPGSRPTPVTSGRDPRLRPPDPAGTQPKHDPGDLLPKRTRGSLWAEHPVISGEAIEEPMRFRPPEPPPDRLPQRRPAPVAAHGDGGSRFAPRFQFITGALIAIAAAAVVLVVVIAAGGGKGSSSDPATGQGTAWSTWRPVAGQTDPATQIADHVGTEYRSLDGRQLVAVTGGPMQIAGLPITVAIRETAAQGGDIKLLDGSGVLYRMCGLGNKCAMDGKPSEDRMLLLRREALELALYSFHYLGVEQAVVFLPPVTLTSTGSSASGSGSSAGSSSSSSSSGATADTASVALLFRRGDQDVTSLVGRPLGRSLSAHTPTVATVAQSPDAQLVTTVTERKLFEFSFQQSNQDARAFLVLDPLNG